MDPEAVGFRFIVLGDERGGLLQMLGFPKASVLFICPSSIGYSIALSEVGSAGSFSDAAWRSSSNRDVVMEGYCWGSHVAVTDVPPVHSSLRFRRSRSLIV